MQNDPRYAVVNNGRTYPPLTRADAHIYAMRLIHKFGSPSDAAVRSELVGNTYIMRDARRSELVRIYKLWTDGGQTGRRCWASMSETIGHGKGWGRLIHDVSHMIHRYRHPKARAHEHGHEKIELDVMRHVEAEGWLVVPEPEPKAARKARENSHKLLSLQERIMRWESKERRAKNALKKLRAALKRLNARQAKIVTGV